MRALPTAFLPAFAFTILLSACSSPAPETQDTDPVETEIADTEAAPEPTPLTLEDAVAADWRSDDARARDIWRNPAETLAFFEIDPASTVIEVFPGGGWYTDIIAPWMASHGGHYIAAWSPIDPENARAQAFQDRFLSKFDAENFGDVELVEFSSETGPMRPDGPVDAVLTFRNVHNWMAADYAEKAFADFYDVLKPGGILGVVEHRLLADEIQDPRASSGYVQQDYVIALASEAGFEFVSASEINANPADTADHPFGVWTLPPVGRSAPRGEPANPDFDRTGYDAIGESDRMTLLFRKPDTVSAPETPGE